MANQSSENQGPVSPTDGKLRGGGQGVTGNRSKDQPPLSSENDDGANKLK